MTTSLCQILCRNIKSNSWQHHDDIGPGANGLHFAFSYWSASQMKAGLKFIPRCRPDYCACAEHKTMVGGHSWYFASFKSLLLPNASVYDETMSTYLAIPTALKCILAGVSMTCNAMKLVIFEYFHACSCFLCTNAFERFVKFSTFSCSAHSSGLLLGLTQRSSPQNPVRFDLLQYMNGQNCPIHCVKWEPLQALKVCSLSICILTEMFGPYNQQEKQYQSILILRAVPIPLYMPTADSVRSCKTYRSRF